ncbi:MAG: hypothetical protein QHH07_10085, partial [Sedimentisphaerales bacterium]|nr:hypothetical protein [Sedimentisphaerales bacterium]
MNKKVISAIGLVVLSLAISARAEPFSVEPIQDGHVCNDTQYGPTQSYDTPAIHVRNIASRRRVGYVMYDISGLKVSGRIFENVTLSVMGYDPGPITVYGIKENLDDAFVGLNFNQLTWATVPAGVPNNPLPAVDSPVQLKVEDLVGPLLSFTAPARGVRASTDPSQELADFLNQDTDGIIVLLLAPSNEGGNAIIRCMEYTDGALRIEGELGGLPLGASSPHPADKSTEVPVDALLSWNPGANAIAHDVYLGTKQEDVAAATANQPIGVLVSKGQTGTTFDAFGILAFGQTYYWRV